MENQFSSCELAAQSDIPLVGVIAEVIQYFW